MVGAPALYIKMPSQMFLSSGLVKGIFELARQLCVGDSISTGSSLSNDASQRLFAQTLSQSHHEKVDHGIYIKCRSVSRIR